MNKNEMNKASNEKADKKKYLSPSFTIYGNISELTRAVDMVGATDGGGQISMNRT